MGVGVTLSNPIPTRGRAEQTQLRPRVRFFVDFRRGTAEALTGQPFSSNQGLQRVSAQNGVSYLTGSNLPMLTYTPGGVGHSSFGGLQYTGVNAQLRISQRPLVPFQIAWHGMLPKADGFVRSFFSFGGLLGPNIELRCDDDGVFGQYNSGPTLIQTAKVQMTRQQECFVVIQMIPDGSANVRIRLAVKRRVAFDDPPWEIGASSSATDCVLSLSDSVLNANPNGLDVVNYRIIWQDGTNDVEELPWDWNARRDGLPGAYGLTENGFIELVLDAGNELYFRDDPSHVSIDTDPPTDYLALAPGGISSPYIYLESLV